MGDKYSEKKAFAIHQSSSVIHRPRTIENFCFFDVICVIFSMACMAADVITDSILVISYARKGHTTWALLTLGFIVGSAVVVQFFSLRWYHHDRKKLTLYDWVTHVFFLGLARRYILVLQNTLKLHSGRISREAINYQQSDICILHLFDSFLEAAPQLVLQLYIMITIDDWQILTGISAIASLCSLSWAIAAYTRAMRRVYAKEKQISRVGLTLQAIWRAGMLSARISTLVLFSLTFKSWIFVFMLTHWICVTAWIFTQKTDFCPTVWEERIYNCVVGVIYCFCFFNTRDGPTRYRVTCFYVIIISQNIACLLLTIFYNRTIKMEILLGAGICIVFGSLIGLFSMILYYIKFHPSSSVVSKYHKEIERKSSIDQQDGETSRQASVQRSVTMRSLKNPWNKETWASGDEENGELPHERSMSQQEDCTDKKLLLENWMARSGTPLFASAPIEPNIAVSINQVNSTVLRERVVVDDVEFYSVHETTAKDVSDGGIVNQSFDETEVNDCSQTKRKCIYSSGKSTTSEDLYDIVIEKPSNPEFASIQSYLSLLSSNEKTKRRSILADDLNVMEAASEILSAHDYENICAVNIARESWGLRSWNGYFDIETYYHDDSTVHDGHRDTLTSYSSELSSAKDGFEIRDVTATFDVAKKLEDTCSDCDSKSTEDSSIFMAKPYMIDQYGSLYPVVSLEPIIEELEDYSSSNSDATLPYNRRSTSTVSSLVATIDEIRCSSTGDGESPCVKTIWDVNSPKNVRPRNISLRRNIAKSLWPKPDIAKTIEKSLPCNKHLENSLSEDDSLSSDLSPSATVAESVNVNDQKIENGVGIVEISKNVISCPVASELTAKNLSEFEALTNETSRIEAKNHTGDIIKIKVGKRVSFSNDTSDSTNLGKTGMSKFFPLVNKKAAISQSDISIFKNFNQNELESNYVNLHKNEMKNQPYDLSNEQGVFLSQLKTKDCHKMDTPASKTTAISFPTKPRRKFSLLRERFEFKPRIQIVPDYINRVKNRGKKPNDDVLRKVKQIHQDIEPTRTATEDLDSYVEQNKVLPITVDVETVDMKKATAKLKEEFLASTDHGNVKCLSDNIDGNFENLDKIEKLEKFPSVKERVNIFSKNPNLNLSTAKSRYAKN